MFTAAGALFWGLKFSKSVAFGLLLKKPGSRSGHFDIKEAKNKNKSMVVEIWLLGLTRQKSRAEKLNFRS